jgi:hypothetical protein
MVPELLLGKAGRCQTLYPRAAAVSREILLHGFPNPGILLHLGRTLSVAGNGANPDFFFSIACTQSSAMNDDPVLDLKI